jgi:hypothetical protein
MAVATEARPDVPDSLLRVWRAGVKMRQYFQYGDLQVRYTAIIKPSRYCTT